MGLIFQDKAFKKTFFNITIPIILSELINVLVAGVGILIMGLKANEYQINAVNCVQNVYLVFNIASLGLIYIATTLFSQYFGYKDRLSIKKVFFLTQISEIALSLTIFLVCLIIPKQIISLFTNQEETIRIATGYLRVYSISFLFNGITFINNALLKSIKKERSALNSSLTALVINISFSFLLVFTSFDTLGIYSVAISVLIARFVECLISHHYAFQHANLDYKYLHVDMSFNKKLIKYFYSHAIPLMLSKLAWAVGAIATSAVLGRLTIEAITANSIFNTFKNYFTVIGNGLGIAVNILIAKELGENKLDEVKSQKKTIYKLVLIFGLIQMSCCLLSIPLSMLIFKNTVNDYVWIFFLMFAPINLIQVLNSTTENGILNAGGDTLFVTIEDALGPWLIVFPLTLMAYKLNLNPIVIFLFTLLDETIRGPFNVVRVNQNKWIRNVVKE